MKPAANVFAHGWRWWRRARWGRATVVLLGLAGLALVVASMLPRPGPDAAWLRDFLMTAGASLALFAPFYLITRSLDRHLDRVAAQAERRVEELRVEAAQTSTALTDQVEALREDVDRRLSDVTERVTARLAAEAAADRAALAALRSAPTREVFLDAFERAQRLGLITAQRPPRVNISRHSHLYISVLLDLGEWVNEEPLQLRVETLSGRVEDWIPWPQDQDVEDTLVEVGRALLKHTGERFDPSVLLGGLADLLEAALSHPERRPAIELCPPQWMVCDWGVITYNAPTYGVNLTRLRTSPTIATHVADKPWVDQDSWDAAREAALALFPADPWATSPGEPPPF